MRLKLLFLSLLALSVQAQESHPWEQYLCQVMMVDDMESDTWQHTYDLLCDMEQHPINLNMATREELEELPFLSTQQVEALVAYLYQYGSMKSLSELEMIPEISGQTRQLLSFFVYVGDEHQRPARIRHELTTLVKLPLYKRAGDEKGYLGAPYRHWFRYQMEQGDHLKLGIVGAQDAGEPFFAHENKYGYDYYSPYLEWRKLGRLETLVVGHFRVSMGMGMIMNNSFSLGKLAMLQNLGRNTRTLRAHSSRSEGYLRGVGATVRLGRGVKATTFASYTPMDATLDTLGNARTIVETGYHRTATEMSKKHNLHATRIGGTVQYDVGRFHLGVNGLYVHLDRLLKPNKTQIYNQYKPDGSDFLNASVDYGYRGRRLVLNGETAVDGNGHVASINTLSYAMRNGWSLMALQRFYSYQYESLDAQSYSDGGKVQNESGAYLGLQWNPSPKWQLMAYADYAYYPWARYLEKTSTYAMDYLLQGAHIWKKWKLTARYRWKVRDKIRRARLCADYSTGALSMNTQLDGCWYTDTKREFGMMVSENAAYTYKWLKWNVGAGYFNTDSSNSRIYLYENGLLYTYSMQQFIGEGIRYWLILKASVGKNLTLHAKIGVTDYFDRHHISSSYQQINRSSQTDIEVQARWRL